MEEQLIKKILETTHTLASLKQRVRALKDLMSSQYFEGGLNNNTNSPEAAWLQELPKTAYNFISGKNFNEVFEKIDKQVSLIKPLTVYLSFTPQEPQIEQLSKWIRENFKSVFLIDIKLDSDLIGGCAFIWNGVYHDYSLRQKIQHDRDKVLLQFKEFLNK